MTLVGFILIFMFICLLSNIYLIYISLEPKYEGFKTFIILLATLIILLIILYLMSPSLNDLYLISLLIPTLLIPIQYLFKESFPAKLFIFMTGSLFQLVVFVFATLLCRTLIPGSEPEMEMFFIAIVYLGFSVIALILVYRYFAEKLKLLIQHINIGFWKMYCSFPILVIAFIFFHFFNRGEFVFERSDVISFIFIVGIIIYVYIILFNSLVIQYKKIMIDNEMETFKVISDSQKSYYHMLNTKVKDAAIFRHDFKHNIGVLNSLINDKDIKALKTYIISLSNKLDESAIIKYTSDNTLNAIISHYEHQAEYNEIETNIKIMISDDINIDIYDLCIVLGNLFENAVEACCRMGFKGRSIDIIMEEVNDYLIIKVKNSFNGIVKLDNNRYVTSKKHGGIGLSSIKGIVNKYNGNIKIDNKNKEFSVQVALGLHILNSKKEPK